MITQFDGKIFGSSRAKIVALGYILACLSFNMTHGMTASIPTAVMPSATPAGTGTVNVWGLTKDKKNNVEYRLGVATSSTGAGTSWQKLNDGGTLTSIVAGPFAVMGVNIAIGWPTNNVFYRAGTQETPEGTSWQVINGWLNSLDMDPNGNLWGVNSTQGYANTVFYLPNPFPAGTSTPPTSVTWQQPADAQVLTQISARYGQVWGVNSPTPAPSTPVNNIYYRLGITPSTPVGTSWQPINGSLVFIAAGPNGQLWGTDVKNNVWFSVGLSSSNPTQVNWVQVTKQPLAQVAIDPNNQVWGLSKGGEVFLRTGITPSNLMGTAWQKVDGNLASISAGFGSQSSSVASGVAASTTAGNVVINNAWYGSDSLSYSVNAQTTPLVKAKLQQIVAEYGFLVIPGSLGKLWQWYGLPADPNPSIAQETTAISATVNGVTNIGYRAPDGQDFYLPSTVAGTPQAVAALAAVKASLSSPAQQLSAQGPVVVPANFQLDGGSAEFVTVGNAPAAPVVVKAPSVNGGQEIWALLSGGTLARYNSNELGSNPWVTMNAVDTNNNPIPAPFITISIAQDGTFCLLDANGAAWEYNWTTQNFTKMIVGGASALGCIAAGNANNIWAADTSNRIWQYNLSSGWQLVPGVSGIYVSAGSDDTVMVIDNSGNIWNYSSSGSWTQVPGILDRVTVFNALNIWGINDGTIYQYRNNAWAPILATSSASSTIPATSATASGFIEVAAGSQGTVYIIDNANNVYNNEVALAAGTVSPVTSVVATTPSSIVIGRKDRRQARAAAAAAAAAAGTPIASPRARARRGGKVKLNAANKKAAVAAGKKRKAPARPGKKGMRKQAGRKSAVSATGVTTAAAA